MKFRALNFDYQLEASVYVESTRRSREVIFIRQATQTVGAVNFEPIPKILNKVESEKPDCQKTRDAPSELRLPLPLPQLCSHETTKKWMSELQFRAFINHIVTVASTKRIGSCPWNAAEPQRKISVTQIIDIFQGLGGPLSSIERKEANHNMEDDMIGQAVSCLALVPYRHHSGHAHDNTTFQRLQVTDPSRFSHEDTEVILFAIKVAVAASGRNNCYRKRSYDDTRSNQNEGNSHHPFRKPKRQRENDCLFETSRTKLVSFQCVEEQLQTSLLTETETVHESRQELPVSHEAIGDIPINEFNNIDVESKAHRRIRKEEKRKRRGLKLAKIREKEQQRMERDAFNQAQSKRARREPSSNYDESREKTSNLVSESSDIRCDDMESKDHDILPDDIEGKRGKTEVPTGALDGSDLENIQQPCQSLPDNGSDMHNSIAQRHRLPLGTKISSNFSFPGKTGVALREQEKRSNSAVDYRDGADKSHAPVLGQAFMREQSIEETKQKASSSVLPSANGLTKHETLHRSAMHPNCFANKGAGPVVHCQREPPTLQAVDVANDQASSRDDCIGINGAPDPNPIQVLCTESFLETWGDLVYAITSSQWSQRYSNQPVSCPGEIRFIDSPLLEGCGVDLELSQRGALLLICTSVFDEEAAARDIVVSLAELVATGRYVYIYVVLIYDIATTPNISLCICRLQNAVLHHGRQPPTRVLFKTSTAVSLPESLANIIISREMSHAANSKLTYEDFAESTQFCQQACFLRRLVPSLSGNGAIQCLRLARALSSPADPSFSLLLTNKAMRQQVMLAATSNPSRAPEISPGSMNQLSLLVSARIGP